MVNKCLKTYLKGMYSKSLKEWSKWVSLAVWRYNTTFHTTSKLSLYEIGVQSNSPMLFTIYFGRV